MKWAELETKLQAIGQKTFRLAESSINNAINYLENRGLIERHGDGVVSITRRGWELQKIAETEYYVQELCRKAPGAAQVASAAYWKIAGIASNYQALVLEKLFAGQT